MTLIQYSTRSGGLTSSVDHESIEQDEPGVPRLQIAVDIGASLVRRIEPGRLLL